MVVSEQVEETVHAQQLQLLLGAVARVAGLGRGHLRAQDHVAQQARIGPGLLGARPAGVDPGQVRRPQLVHGEGQDIGRARLPHPALVQLGHGLLVHQQDGQLRQGMNTHLVKDVARDRHQGDLVGPDARLVGDVNAHPCRAGLYRPRFPPPRAAPR
jgi:hypothetical protein